MIQVNINGLRFDGPDKNVLCPSWEFIVSQFSMYIAQINTAISSINTDLGNIIEIVDTWPKKEEGE